MEEKYEVDDGTHTLGDVDFADVEARVLAHYGVEDGMPVPPKKSVLGYSFGPQPFLKAYGRQRERVKPTLLLRAVEPLPGLWMCEARENEDGPRVSTADLGYPLFTSKDGALAFSGDVCAAWWRRYA